VPGKLIEVVPGTDVIVLKIAFVTSDDEFEKATTPNMDAKVVGQPDAARVREGQRCPLYGHRWWDTIPIRRFSCTGRRPK